MAAKKVITLGPSKGVYEPDYQLQFYRDGDPRKPIKGVDLRSVMGISTSKSIDDLAGTFSITLKDRGARHRIREMDVVRIRLQGHRPGLVTVLKGVVDEARPSGSADPFGASLDTVITGRCVGKYLMINSLFLPVWDPQANLPTALVFGLGDAAKKVGGNRPYDIFDYLVRKYGFGERKIAGISGTPAARHWLDHHTRFARHLNYSVPYLQFDEDSLAVALKRLEILGFTETWVDELGRVVYRHPGWDQPVVYNLPTGQLKDYSFPRGDTDVFTYCEVIPAGDPGIDSGAMQALRAGRAPVPSSYVNAAGGDIRGVDPSFIIDTDSKGRPTKKGRRNHWYQLQHRLGLRAQQISSPLIYSQEQAQKQAEGLLRFYARATKTAQCVIPGAPELRLGYNVRVHGTLEEGPIDRVFYIDSIQHEYVEGSHYVTSFTGSHGRDPWDPKFRQIALPKFDPSKVASDGGILDPSSGSNFDDSAIAGARGKVEIRSGAFDRGVTMAPVLHTFLALVAGKAGRKVIVTTGNAGHSYLTASGRPSQHNTGHAADMGNVANGSSGCDAICFAALRLCGMSVEQAGQLASNGIGQAGVALSWQGHKVQVFWKSNDKGIGDHYDHVHIGVG